MGWKEETAVSNKQKFISEALKSDINFSALCKRFGISRECGYKWLRRFHAFGEKGLLEKSRKPLSSPCKTNSTIESHILKVRSKHPAWGGRKICAYLKNQGITSLPVPSTITRLLHRHDLIEEEESIKHTAFIRFEHDHPNSLWQMDFKGYFQTEISVCHPLTILDDHSRYSLLLKACKNQQTSTVQDALIQVFREYGLPERMTMDNGTPWGIPGHEKGYTALAVWLICLGIRVGHSRPFHPQTQGKDERFHRTLKGELLRFHQFKNLEEVQDAFTAWRKMYNHERPHEALNLQPPATRYRPSSRIYSEDLIKIEYDVGSEVRHVRHNGEINYRGKKYFISQSMARLPVRLAESSREGMVEVYLNRQKVKEIDLNNQRTLRKS